MQVVSYYHSISPLEKVLPKLLEKVLASGQRAVVIAPTQAELMFIDSFLWTYSKSELIPHGTEDDGNPHLQPVWLTCTEENPNQASILIVVGDLRPSNITDFTKVLILNPSWSSDQIIWAKNMGNFTLWEEQSSGGWQQASP